MGVKPQRSGVFLIAALCLFLALRLAVLLTSSSTLFYWEETAPLVVAEQLLARPRLPLLEYEASDYQGGPLVVAAMAVPLVWLFGASIPALKLVPLGFAAGTLVVWCGLLGRLFGSTTALLFGLLYALAPPGFVLFNFYGLGTHPETALFSAILVACMARLVAQPTAAPRVSLTIGFVAGFGLWFDYVTALTLAVVLPLGVALAPRILRRTPLFATGFALGFSPWLYYNATHGLPGLVRMREVFAGTGGAGQLRGSLANFGASLADLVSFRESVGLPAAGWALLYVTGAAVGLATAFATLRRHAGPKRLVAVLTVAYPMLVVAAFLASSLAREPGHFSFPVRARVLVVLYPFAFAGMALGLATAWRSVGLRRTAGLLAAALTLATGAVAWAGMLGHGRLDYTPAQLRDMGCTVFGVYSTAAKNRDDPGRAVRNLASLRGAPCRDRAFAGYGWGQLILYEQGAPLERVMAALDVVPLRWRPRAVEGFRYQLEIAERELRQAGADADTRVAQLRAARERLDAAR